MKASRHLPVAGAESEDASVKLWGTRAVDMSLTGSDGPKRLAVQLPNDAPSRHRCAGWRWRGVNGMAHRPRGDGVSGVAPRRRRVGCRNRLSRTSADYLWSSGGHPGVLNDAPSRHRCAGWRWRGVNETAQRRTGATIRPG
jgi:hypothetical protein